MKIKLHASIIALAISLLTAPGTTHAQLGAQLAVPNSPAYEQAANRLRSAPPRQYNFSKAVLSDIMRLMAEDAGISFFGLPEGATGGDRIVTFTINASPFKALETLAKANGISLIFENNIWYLRPADDTELIGRIYEINYNAQELVRKNNEGGGSIGGNSGGSSSQGGTGGGIGLDLQGSPDFFVTEPSRLLEDIKGILDLQTSGVSATFAPTTSVDNINRFNVSGLQGQPNVVVGVPGQAGGEISPADAASQAKVIWNSDANTLYIVATRQQHQWIEGYLAAADQPQSLIAVEVKFLEIRKNPRFDLGIDWSGLLSSNSNDGYGVGVSSSGENGVGLINTAFDLANIGNTALPTAILSFDEVQLRLNALFQDQRNRTVSYPRMVTLDNREVSFRSVVNQPVLGSSASASLGAGATTTSAVEYVPIGTVINVLPKLMANKKLLLNVSITLSDIIGTEIINGNPYPIATSRVYTAPISVESGYTVAISGLDKATNSDNTNGVPLLGRIPIVGYAFKKKSKAKSNQHLMMLITPVVMNPGDPGVLKKPMTQDPWKNTPMIEEPHFTQEGSPQNYEKRTNADLHPYAEAKPLNASAEEKMIADSTSSEKRKGLRIFGKKTAPATAPAVLPENTAQVAETSPASNKAFTPQNPAAAQQGEIVQIHKPERLDMPTLPASNPAAAEKKAGPPAPQTVAAAPKKIPVKASAPEPVAVDSAAARQIVAGADKIDANLRKVPAGESRLSPDDGQMVRNSYEESKRLLSEIDTLRKKDDVPMKGEISDAWWKLVAAKSKAVKLSQRSPDSLAINISND